MKLQKVESQKDQTPLLSAEDIKAQGAEIEITNEAEIFKYTREWKDTEYD